MIRPAVALMLALATPAPAQDLIADAFGLVAADAVGADRRAWAGVRMTGDETQTILPGASDVVTIFAGPKSLVAGRDTGHAVALALDAQGNLVPEGSDASFAIAGTTRRSVTRNGIADTTFPAPTRAQVYVIGAEVDGRQTARATIRVTADLTALDDPVVDVPDDPTRETVVDLTTRPLIDRHGNLADDGTLVTLTLSGGADATVLPAIVIDGRARGHLLLRDTDGGQIAATVAGRVAGGPSLAASQIGYAGTVDAAIWPIPEISAIGLRIGPIGTTAGHQLNDGAPVTAHLTDGAGQAVATQGWLRDGLFEAMLAVDGASGPFEVRVTTALGTVSARVREEKAPPTRPEASE